MQNKYENQDGMVVQPLNIPNKLFMTEGQNGNIFEFYLIGEIGNPEEYTELCHALRVAEPNDIFIIRINSNGGQNRSGDMIINAIRDSVAHVCGHIEQQCMSMATFIFLACDSWSFSRYTEFMCHTCSSGSFGKEPDTFEAAQFLRKQTHKRLKEEYANFLTEDEIERVVAGNDIYLDYDEVSERIELFEAARLEAEGEVEEPEEEENGTLKMIMDAVEKVLDKREKEDLESLSDSVVEHIHKSSVDNLRTDTTIYGKLQE